MQEQELKMRYDRPGLPAWAGPRPGRAERKRRKFCGSAFRCGFDFINNRRFAPEMAAEGRNF